MSTTPPRSFPDTGPLPATKTFDSYPTCTMPTPTNGTTGYLNVIKFWILTVIAWVISFLRSSKRPVVVVRGLMEMAKGRTFEGRKAKDA